MEGIDRGIIIPDIYFGMNTMEIAENMLTGQLLKDIRKSLRGRRDGWIFPGEVRMEPWSWARMGNSYHLGGMREA